MRLSLATSGILCLLLNLSQPNVSAQATTSIVTGTVNGELNGEGLPGVNILLKGTSTGTVTDQSGNYRIEVPAGKQVLVFSFIGYETQEITVTGQNVLNVTLDPDVRSLSEVVVVGYGTQKLKDVTGSISSISARDIQNQPASNIEALLQGRAAGVQISQASGAPGGNLNIRIRGASSINAGNEPLYVIDGVPIYNGSKDPSGTSYGTFNSTNALASLNTEDIESIQILKDASATAIYGSRGNNGVIIITTKRGKSEKSQISYSGYYGVQKVIRNLDLLNGAEHAQFLNEWADANNITRPFSDPAAIGEGTNWQDQIFRSAAIQNHQLSLSGGTGKTRYFISGNYFDQQGIVLNSDLKRYSLRVNLDNQINDKVTFSQSLTYSRTVNNSVPIASVGDGNIRTPAEKARVTSPTVPVFDENGAYTDTWYGASKAENPVASMLSTFNQLAGDNVLGNVSLDYTPLPGFTLKTLWGVNLTNRNLEEYYPAASTYIGGILGGLGMVSSSRRTNILNENTARYTKVFGEVHDLEVLGGFTWQTENIRNASVQTSNYPDDRLGINAAGGATGVPVAGYNQTEWSLASWLGRVNYKFRDKYLLTASFRADGSSRFGSGNRWGYFPSFALGYRLSEEAFLRDVSFLDDLKIRAGYGMTGNQEIGSYQSMARLVTDAIYIFDNQLVSGSRQSSLENSRLSWEKAGQLDLGVDVALFSNRLRFVFDYYRKTTQDLLFTINLPANSGYSTALFNTGGVENKGFELSADAAIFDQDFKWDASFNYSRNRNQITSLGQNASTTLFVGYPPGMILGYVYDGVFRNQQEIDAQTVQQGVRPGDIRYKDVNGDGVLTADDREIIGNPLPRYIFGFNNSFSYKGFYMSVFLQGSVGGQGNRIAGLFNPADVASNKSTDLLRRWTPENPDTDIPRAGVSNWLASTFLLQDLSYVKIRNIQLGYNLPQKTIPFLRGATIYLSGQNLVTLTRNYTGYDPDGGESYPTARVTMLGLNLNF